MRTVAILPVKSFDRAKQRLASDLDPEIRSDLAAAMFADVLDALGRTTAVAEVLVVTGGGLARQSAQSHSAHVIEDSELGHNQAATLGVQAALQLGAARVLLVPGDCPALDASELDSLLARPVDPPSALIVPDRHRTGTNALVLTPPDVIDPAFGPGSCARHLRLARSAGATAEVVNVPSLAIDIDTRDDLEVLEQTLTTRPRPAERTRQLLSELSRC